jgi:predicted TIM-barrel fold metal-dependent hydrolase
MHTMRSVLLYLTASLLAVGVPQASPRPAVDHHQHLFSPALGPVAAGLAITAGDLIAQLDQAGIRRAAVFSVAYGFGNPNRPPVEDEYTKVKAENDRVAREIARYPDRLVGFCGVNPLKDYALAEVARCAKIPEIRDGLKLHFGNSDVMLDNPAHVAALRQVFRAANDARMAIVVHMRSSVTMKRPYGAAQASVFLDEVLPSAPDVTVQIAHLAGAGGYDDPTFDEALGVFVDALARNDPRVKRVYIEVSGIAGIGRSHDRDTLVVERIRRIGPARILYGSDGPPMAAWTAFTQLPLTAAEIAAIAANVAPYMR